MKSALWCLLLCAWLLAAASLHAPSHVKYMSFYGFDPEAQHTWSNLGGEGPASEKVGPVPCVLFYAAVFDRRGGCCQVDAFQKYGMKSLYGGLSSDESDGVFHRGVGLWPNWRANLDRVRLLLGAWLLRLWNSRVALCRLWPRPRSSWTTAR